MISNPDNLKFYSRINWSSDNIEIGIKHKNLVATGLTFIEHEPGVSMDPAIKLNHAEAQSLIDSLYQCGIRPSAEFGATSELTATKYHLEDMRFLLKMQKTP